MAGTLFVVATPIGNLEDLSFRALRVLKEVDVIAAEDTRRTAKLLAHYAIRKPMVSLHEHNERRETPRLLARISAGESIALVSDAGTPGISDPGEHLVRACREANLPVSPIPGPSAVMAALSASGVPASEFVFLGFAPRSGKERDIWFNNLATEVRTAVFFEAPHRIKRTLAKSHQLLVNKPIYIHREVSKLNEEFVEQPTIGPDVYVRELGEFVVVVGPAFIEEASGSTLEADMATSIRIVDCLTEKGDFSDEAAESLAAAALGLDRQVVRKARKKHRIALKQQDSGER